jgi:hypothetical protein
MRKTEDLARRLWSRWADWQPTARSAWVVGGFATLVVLVLASLVFMHSTSSASDAASGGAGSGAGTTQPSPTTIPEGNPGTSNTVPSGEGSGGSSLGGNGSTADNGTGESISGQVPDSSTGGTGASGSAASSGLTAAPSGEVGAMTGAVADPPGAVSSVEVPSDPTYAVIDYGGGGLALVQQGGGLSPAGDDEQSNPNGQWTELAQGTTQLPCVNSLPVSVSSALAGMMAGCG